MHFQGRILFTPSAICVEPGKGAVVVSGGGGGADVRKRRFLYIHLQTPLVFKYSGSSQETGMHEVYIPSI